MKTRNRGRAYGQLRPGELITTATANENSITDETLRRAKRSGAVTPIVIGSTPWYETDELIAWIKSQKQRSEAA